MKGLSCILVGSSISFPFPEASSLELHSVDYGFGKKMLANLHVVAKHGSSLYIISYHTQKKNYKF